MPSAPIEVEDSPSGTTHFTKPFLFGNRLESLTAVSIHLATLDADDSVSSRVRNAWFADAERRLCGDNEIVDFMSEELNKRVWKHVQREMSRDSKTFGERTESVVRSTLARFVRQQLQEMKNEAALDRLVEFEARLRHSDVLNLGPTLLSQSLVTACAVLESYLVDCVETLVPKYFLFLVASLGKDKEWDALLDNSSEDDEFDAVDDSDDDEFCAETYMDALYESHGRKASAGLVQRFERAGIREKVEVLSRFLDFDKAVCVGNPPVVVGAAARSADEGREFLFATFQKRHDVAHRGSLGIQRPEDLDDVVSFFKCLMVGLADCIRRKFGIPSDMELILKGKLSPYGY